MERTKYFTMAFLVILISLEESSQNVVRQRKSSLKKRAIDAGSAANAVDDTIDAEGKYTGGFSNDCSESATITPTQKTFQIEPEESVFQAKGTCHWNIIGTDNCIPILNCRKFKLTPNPPNAAEPCVDEHLEVTDGFEGYMRFCGDDGPKNLTTSRGLRDLYITYKPSPDSKTSDRAFKCTVTCSLGGDVGPTKVLENNFQAEKDEFCTCGRKPNGNRIVGGEAANRGEFPWIVALVTANTRKPYCGGSIINDKFILTAAHCFKGPYQNVANFQVLMNGRVLELTTTAGTAAQDGGERQALSPAEAKELAAKDAADEAVRIDVEKYFIHPLYIRQTNDYDLALIKLKQKIDFRKYSFLQPICLPKMHTYNVTYENEIAVVAGWGLDAANATSTMGTLQKLNITVFPTKECKTFFDERMTSRMLCAGYREGGKDACKGDSGGPLIAKKYAQVWQLIGAVSWGEGCAAKNSPGVYTRISETNQWIRYICNMGEAAWCRGKEE